MAVENTVNAKTYASQTYQNSTEYSSGRKDMTGKTDRWDKTDVNADAQTQVDIAKKSEALDNVPITLDSVKDKDVDKSLDEKIQDVIEDQKFVHDKIRKSLDDYSSRMGNYEAKFGMHEATNRVMIKLVDKDTKEVIKELPPEKTLDMIAKCLEQAGILVDEKV